ncbi:type II toxin-antitoxin system YafO family toxin [Yersinia enterocolitica]|uniref:type II toxin-antitoxin system YafO family toxin n=1 Tax=Yersinia enterocolitica TaxID=630 RepID=UPI001C8F09B5|nr:type II toxin-antitoxin system YafO family toxin [Yersinia enterocolitica]MBX9489997.1 type II toxin-antitoxin system YafO family toxin [Yersinia enterocolitica]MBX9494178.1 type II toxin-antitoxin system YafO family toxin [Yersinia enterocolitica]
MATGDLKGKIYFGDPYKTMALSNPVAEKLREAFKIFWRQGYHPLFGKNVCYGTPAEILEYSIFHVHIDVGDYDENDKSACKAAWDAWKNTGGKPKHKRPTSNSFLSYAVNEDRDAYVMHIFYAEAHKCSYLSEFTEFAINESQHFYKQTKTKPMHIDEHDSLFNKKHIEK